MRSLPIPQEVVAVLTPLNPFILRWGNGVEAKLRALEGPDREVADRLVSSLADFPPDPSRFDVLEVLGGLGTLGYTVLVASGTAQRVAVTARYRQAFRDVIIRDIQAGRRVPGALKNPRPKPKGA